MTEEQIKALKEVRSIIDVVICTDPTLDCAESIRDLMNIAWQKVNGILAENHA